MTSLLLALALGAAPTPVCIVPDGTRVQLETAENDEDRARGLMFRDVLAPDAGMVFVFDSDGRYPFWMKNTMIPLDMIWLSADGKVVDVLAAVPPCRMDPCPSYGGTVPARAVLEVSSGFAAAHRIVPGAVLRFVGVPHSPAAAGGTR